MGGPRVKQRQASLVPGPRGSEILWKMSKSTPFRSQAETIRLALELTYRSLPESALKLSRWLSAAEWDCLTEIIGKTDAAKPNAFATPEMLAYALSMTLNYANRPGDQWALDEQEREAIRLNPNSEAGSLARLKGDSWTATLIGKVRQFTMSDALWCVVVIRRYNRYRKTMPEGTAWYSWDWVPPSEPAPEPVDEEIDATDLD